MKNILFPLVTILLLVSVSSCKDETDEIKKGTLTTATYNHTTSSFTLTYSNGSTETVDAVIDSSVVPPTASYTMANGTILSVEDATISGKATIITSNNTSNYKYVNNWIYDEMSIYYLWNDKLPKTPDYSLRPDNFFSSLLYTYHSVSNKDGDRFSLIQEDYVDLLENLSGVSSDEIGFEYTLVPVSQGNNYYALVLYSMPGTVAAAKGINRGQFVTKINGQDITAQNYRNLLGGTGTKQLSMADWVYNEEEDTYRLTNTGVETIQMHSKYAENPVYMDSIYPIEGGNVGYLVYNFFATDEGNDSYDYDKLLMQKLSNMQSRGVNEMVLDLRYNGGGAVSSAYALASALVKNRSTDNIIAIAQYNNVVHTSLARQYGADYNKDYFIERIDTAKVDRNGKIIEWIKITDIPTLNLPRLYVLTSGWTASASELIINTLKPYMEVVLIGETTYGKNVGSISIYEKNDPRNKWGMQPIIVRFANSKGESEYTAGFSPNYKIDEFEDLFLYDWGDTNDPLLGKALSLITGVPTTSTTRSAMNFYSPLRSAGIDRVPSIRVQKTRHFDMYDDIRGDEIRRLIPK